MRKITSFLCSFLISASFLLLSCTTESGNTPDPNESETPNEEVASNDSALLSIEGMMCPSGCAKPIQEKLAGGSMINVLMKESFPALIVKKHL